MAESGSKVTVPVAVLGWVVAVLSLGLNYLNYRDSATERKLRDAQAPIFAYNLSTYDTTSLPKEILDVKNAVRHNFEISHRSGHRVKGLVVAFKSEGPPISGINVTEGNQGTTTDVDIGKLEATLKRDELLPSQIIRGYVTTAGVAKLTATAGAAEGTDIPSTAQPPKNDRFDSGNLSLYLVMGVVFAVALVLLYASRRVFTDSGMFDVGSRSGGRSALLLLLILLAIMPGLEILPRAGALFEAFLAYFLVTNYRNIVRALENLADSRPASGSPASTLPSIK